MTERKYGWCFPIPKGELKWKDILIFHTYAYALAIWPWIILSIALPVTGGPQGFMMLLCLPIAIISSFVYTLVVVCKNINMNKRKKNVLIALVILVPMMVLVGPSVIMKDTYYLFWSMRILAIPLLLTALPGLLMGLGCMFSIPLLGIYRKK